MKIIEESFSKIKFQVKIKNRYVTIATLQRWMLDLRRYELFFSYYGNEYNTGLYGYEHLNGNLSITIKQSPYETRREMIERASKIVRKKLYQIANDILIDLKEPTGAERSDKE